MKRPLLFILFLTFAFWSSSAFALEKVRIAQFGKEKFLLYLPLYIAMEKGYFAKEGLEVDLSFAGNDDQIFATVASGSVDFGVGDPVFVAIAEEKGFPGKTVALLIQNLGLSGYTKNPDQKFIEKAGDLEGLRIGSFPKPSTTYTQLDAIRRDHHLKSMEIVEASMGAQPGLLAADKADIVLDLEPSVSKMESQGYKVVFQLNRFTEPQAITGLTTTGDYIDKNPAKVQSVVNALQRAMQDLNSDSKTPREVARKLFPDLSPDVVDHALTRMKAAHIYPASVVIPDDYWQRTLKTRLDSGDLKKPQATNLAVDNRFAEKAALKDK